MTNVFKLQAFYAMIADWCIENGRHPGAAIRGPAFHVEPAALKEIRDFLDGVYGND